LWVQIKIFYLAHCMTVPVNFDRGAARSGIRQIGNVIILHLWSSFIDLAGLKLSDGILLGAFSIIYGRRCFRHYTRCFRHYTRWFEQYTRCFRHDTGFFYHYNLKMISSRICACARNIVCGVHKQTTLMQIT
jgi:hypothetical protein